MADERSGNLTANLVLDLNINKAGFCFFLHGQYNAYWCPSKSESQGICKHGDIELIYQGYSTPHHWLI